MRTLKLVLAYDGTAYHGWQLQPNGVTVQQVVEESIARILGPHRLMAAGRTDAGVHALGQVAALRTGKPMPPETLHRALNAHLPSDVACLRVEEVDSTFDPQRDALSKLYRYRIWTLPERPVLVRHLVWQVWGVDWERVERALAVVAGRQDFASFQDSGCNRVTTARTLSRVELIRSPPAEHEVWIEVEGDGFLKHMVRNIVGTAMMIGREHDPRPPEEIMGAVLAARDRRAAGPTAPAQGLTLVEVRYR